MVKLSLLLIMLFILVALVYTPRVWALEKNEFQVIPESAHFYKGQVKTTDNLLRNVEVELFIATRTEATKKSFVSVVVSWDPMSGFSYWSTAPYLDGKEPEPSHLDGKQFDAASYLTHANIYISNIGIASWRVFSNTEDLFIRGFADQFKTLGDARNSVLSKLSEFTIDQIRQPELKSLSLWKHMPYSFFRKSLLCNMCEFRAKLTNVRVAGGKWLISISGGYQTDAELVLDKSYNIVKVCIHPAKDTKNEKPN